MKRSSAILMAISLLVIVAGCDLNPSPAPSGPTPTPQPIKPIAQAGGNVNNFAAYKPVSVRVKPGVPDYSTDPAQAARQDVLDYYHLSNDATSLLQQNGFVVLSNQTNQNIYDVYLSADRNGIPVIVTVDPLLHTYHLLYDYTLRRIETDYLAADAKALTAAMLQATQQQYAATGGMSNAHEAARRNLAYFAVASKLFDDSATVPAEVSDVVNQELSLINAHAGFNASPLFGSQLDYSQFVPRGHYTRSDLLKRYFMGMMWYGLTNFRVDPNAAPNGGDVAAAVRIETRQALMISALLADPSLKAGDSTALDKWQRIYEPTNFFVGQSDDLTVYDYTSLAATTFGSSLSMSDLDSDAKIDQFMQAVASLPAPKINGGLQADNEGQTALKGWRFMGQRFIPDSYIFQQLVYDKVGTQVTPRSFPKGLDVTAAMGSNRAYAILKQMGEDKYANYDKQMQKLKGEFAAVDTTTWTQNLYWNWLYSLKPLTEPKGAGYPRFMQNDAWSDQQLYSYLGSWTELRHDTILYAKQSNTILATGMGIPANPPPPPRGYVEPQPDVYARLEGLAQQSVDGLTARGLLPADYRQQFETIITSTARLRSISEAELNGTPISDDDYTFIRNFGNAIAGVDSFVVSQDDLSNSADNRMANVADVHTDPNSGKALEEGVGNAFTIIVIAPVDGKPSLLVGSQFSQYEFTQPMDNRLTDEQWQQQLDRNPPSLADWTRSFIR